MDAEHERTVLDRAMALFAKEELRDFTLDQLTEASGIPSAHIIRRFHSSENILKAVLSRELEAIAATAEPLTLGETLANGLGALAAVILEGYRRRRPLLTRLLGESMRDPHVGAIFYSTFVAGGRHIISEFLRARAASGEVREDLDIETAASMFFAALMSLLLSDSDKLDEDRALRGTCETFLRGVARNPPPQR